MRLIKWLIFHRGGFVGERVGELHGSGCSNSRVEFCVRTEGKGGRGEGKQLQVMSWP